MLYISEKETIKRLNCIHCLVILFLFTSCASYHYNKKRENNTISISSNAKEFHLDFPKWSNTEYLDLNSSLPKSTSHGTLNLVLPKLNKRFQTIEIVSEKYDTKTIQLKKTVRIGALAADVGLGIFTAGIPVIVDVFRSDFYKLKKTSQKFYVELDYKQSYMHSEFLAIKDSINPELFEDYISFFPKSNDIQSATDIKDSLELSIAIKKESEEAIDTYISTHQSSNYLNSAKKIKTDMVVAREAFVLACGQNTVESYESFLSKFPISIHNSDAHRKLTEAAEKIALSKKMVVEFDKYLSNYLIPNKEYFTSNIYDQKFSLVSKELDQAIIKEFDITTNANKYDVYSKLWKKFDDFATRFEGIDLPKTYSYKAKISDVVFKKIVEANTELKQNELSAKLNYDFPNFRKYESSDQILVCMLNNVSAASGTAKLFSSNFFRSYFDQMSERDALKGYDYFTYMGAEIEAITDQINFEEITYLNGKLSGVLKAYEAGKTSLSINMANGLPKEISYYRYGVLAKTIFFDAGNESYNYEFSGGANITLQFINDKFIQITNLEKSINQSISSKDIERALNLCLESNELIDQIVEYAEKNRIPKDKWTNNVATKLNNLNSILGKIKKEEKKAEIIAQQQKKQRELNYRKELQKQDQKLNSLLNEITSCYCCPQQFYRKNGWNCRDYDCTRLTDNGEISSRYIAYTSMFYSPEQAVREFKFCSKKCALNCGN